MACGAADAFVRPAGQLRRPFNQRRKQIRFVIRNHTLQHGRHPLQTHPRIDRRLGQRIQLPAHVAVKLHEHQIPNFDVPPAVAAKLAIRMSLIGGNCSHVVMDLAAWPARSRVAHLPEVIFQPHLVDTRFLYALRNPQIVSLGVSRYTSFAFKNRDVKLVLGNAVPLG